jgi:alcohol dehydrogenase class IV
VCKYNALHGSTEVRDRQRDIREILWSVPIARERFVERGLSGGEGDLGDLIAAIVKELGLKGSLREVGVGRERFGQLAENSLKDPFLVENPVPIHRKEEVLEILEMCA